MTESAALVILVVESDRLLRDLIGMTLRRGGYSPLLCSQPSSARASLDQHRPDIVIVDTFLPEENGLDFIENLRAERRLEDQPVILISSLAFSEVVVRAKKIGAAAFLAKPIDSDLLLEQIDQIISR